MAEPNSKKRTANNPSGSSNQSTTTYISPTNANINSELNRSIDGSMRLFGLPHQFTAENDPRIGSKSKLGRCFAERIVMEAPIVCLKPGVPDFLPGKSTEEKEGFVNAIIDATNGNANMRSVFSSIKNSDGDDVIPYYKIKDSYSEMMAKVNLMIKLMALFLGLSNTSVPWSKTATFGTYDWRYYSLKNQYNDITFTKQIGTGGALGMFIRNALKNASENIMNDTQWVRFYVDSNASFGESASNSTTSSILESYTEKLESVAKELDVISGMVGTSVGDIVDKTTSSVDNYIQSNVKSDSAFGTLLKRISGNTTQILSGGNFLIPEIWSQSEYNKSYSFTITLSTPYGNVKSWFLNIGVPLCHILGLCLPQQLTANTYKSPYLVKCYSPGWFNCNYGIIDSISIEKGADNSWSVGGLPNEVKISLSVKDLYSTLSIPQQPYENPSAFLSTGMLEFLMVNCSVDITQQDMGEKVKIWTTILSNNFRDRFTSRPYNVQQFFKSRIQKLFNVIN